MFHIAHIILQFTPQNFIVMSKLLIIYIKEVQFVNMFIIVNLRNDKIYYKVFILINIVLYLKF